MVEGTPAVLVPVHQLVRRARFSGLASGRLLLRLVGLIAGADVVHVHVSRDLVTMPGSALALLLRKPLVLHCHGMIVPSERRSAALYDSVLTRTILRRADRVLVLTPAERRQIETVAGAALPKLDVVENGVDVSNPRTGQRSDTLVLFAARLAERKRPETFIEMADLVHRSVPEASFVLIGPDEGRADAVRAMVRDRPYVVHLGPLPHSEVLDWMARSAVYVLPAVDEPFGMTVAEAMSVGTPVVVTDSCGAGTAVRNHNAGHVTGPAAPELAAAVVDLLTDRTRRLERGRNAGLVARTAFDLTTMAGRVNEIYADVLSERVRPQS